MLFCRHYFSPRSTFMRKGKDREPDPDSYLWLMDQIWIREVQKHADPADADPVPDPDPQHWVEVVGPHSVTSIFGSILE